MQPLLHLVSPVAALAASSLVASIWEGTLLTMAVWLGLRAVPGLSAAARSVVWVAVLLLVLVLPWMSFGMAEMRSLSAAQNHADVLRLGEPWGVALAGVWAALSAFRLVQLGASALRLRSLARHAVPVQPGERVAALLQGSSRRAELCTSDEVDRPSVAGFFRPRILLPPELFLSLSEAELEQVVLHELEHLRRRDDWTNLLQKLGLALLPLNPVLLWLDHRLCTERELACDDGVLRATNARKAYAACLAGLAEQSILRRGVVLALGMVGNFGRRRTELERRVYRILGRPEPVMGGPQAKAATGLFLAGAAFAALALAASPKLISFGPGESFPAARVQAATEVGPKAITRAAGNAHPMFVKAAVPSHAAQDAARTPRLLAAVAMHKRKPAVIKAVSLRSDEEARPRLVTAEWRTDVAAPHLVFAVYAESQIRYAAVPVQGGWLIVQL